MPNAAVTSGNHLAHTGVPVASCMLGVDVCEQSQSGRRGATCSLLNRQQFINTTFNTVIRTNKSTHAAGCYVNSGSCIEQVLVGAPELLAWKLKGKVCDYVREKNNTANDKLKT